MGRYTMKISTELTLKIRVDPALFEGVGVVYSIDRSSILLSNPVLDSLSRSEIKDGELKHGQSVVLKFGTIFPKDNKVCLTINPDILNLGVICSYTVTYLPSKSPQPVNIILHAVKSAKIPNDTWIVGLHAVE